MPSEGRPANQHGSDRTPCTGLLRHLEIVDHADLDARDFDDGGNYKFPHAVALAEVWRFGPPPLLSDVLASQLTMVATPGVEEIGEEDVARVLALPAERLLLPELPALKRMRRLNEGHRPTTGPRPGDANYMVERSGHGAASTYAFRFGKRNLFKIGHAEDVQGRLAAVNQHGPVEVLNEQCSVYLTHRWPTSVDVYDMEQRLLKHMEARPGGFERVQCSEGDLSSAWASALISDYLTGAILLAVGVLVISTIDNFLRPALVGRETRLPDYVVLISTVGGLSLIGMNGFVIGPLIAALFVADWSPFTEEQLHS